MSPRPGIYKRWISVSSVKKRFQEYLLSYPMNRKNGGWAASSEHYIQTGERDPNFPLPPFLLKNPPPPWHRAVVDLGQHSGWLDTIGLLQLLEGNNEGWFSLNRAHSALRICIIAGYHPFVLTSGRLPTYEGAGAAMSPIYTMAGLAFVLGHRPTAERQARLMIEAYRQGYFGGHFSVNTYPIYHVLLRVWADWLGIEPPQWGAGATQEPILNELFAHWREPDPEVLAAYLINACDFHTQRCRVTKKGATDWYEFEMPSYQRFPVEILVIFRIRQWMGLTNPKLDHPLMHSLLGELPPPMEPEMDNLTRRVYERMRSQGFDEDEVYRLMVEVVPCVPSTIDTSNLES